MSRRVDGYDPGTVEAVQLEDGSTAYIHHPSALQSGGAILTVQAGGTLEELAADPDTISTLEAYAARVRITNTHTHANAQEAVTVITMLNN